MTFDDQWCFNPPFPAWGPKMPPRCSHWTPFASHPGRLTSPTSTRDLPRNLPWFKPWTLDDLGIYHPKRFFYHGKQWDSTKKHWDFVMIFRFNHLKYQFYHRNSCCIPTPCQPPGTLAVNSGAAQIPSSSHFTLKTWQKCFILKALDSTIETNFDQAVQLCIS